MKEGLVKASSKTSLLGLALVAATAGAEGWPFPEFLGGVSNSAFQVEGSPVESDWTRWTKIPGKIKDASNAERASDFWNRYEEDFAWSEKLGAKAFRLSIAWERIEPREGVFDDKALAHYEQMLVALRRRGQEPVVTLHHFVLPAWLADKGGLEAPEFAALFSRYASKVTDRLALAPANVRLWMTFNEPMVLVHQGYLKGEWPPGRRDDARGAMRAAANMAKAHLLTVVAERVKHPDTLWSVAAHWRVFQPVGKWLDPWFARLSNWAFNTQFLDSLHSGKILFWMPGSEIVRDRVELGGRSSMDYAGLNYYGRLMVEFTPKPPFVVVEEGPGPKQDLKWEMYPDGLEQAAKDIYVRYRLPIFVTENGLADAQDQWRAQFTADHLAALQRAQSAGVPVVGYLHWSLTDNFEWAEGLKSRFGLIEIDYATGNRKPRASLEAVAKILREWKPSNDPKKP